MSRTLTDGESLIEDVETIELMATNLVKQVGSGLGSQLSKNLLNRVRQLERKIAASALPTDDAAGTDLGPSGHAIDPESAIEYEAAAELEKAIAIFNTLPVGYELVLRRTES